MKEFHGRASARVEAPPKEVFDLITDVGCLPEWNAAIEAVIDRSSVLADDTQWTVKVHAPHVPSWGSDSHVEELDQQNPRSSYDTRNADGNPPLTR